MRRMAGGWGGGKKQKETTVLQGSILRYINREELITTTIYSKELLHGRGVGGEGWGWGLGTRTEKQRTCPGVSKAHIWSHKSQSF